MPHAGYMERYTKSLAKQAVAEYAAVAKKHGVTPTELALAWCKQKWQVTSTIIGATSLEQLKVRAAAPWRTVRSTTVQQKEKQDSSGIVILWELRYGHLRKLMAHRKLPDVHPDSVQRLCK